VSTDELLTAIEAMSGDTKACVLHGADVGRRLPAQRLDTLPDEIGEQIGDAEVGFRVLVLADEPRVDLLLGDRFMPMASVSAAALARPRQ
jgi:hypothetical protein